MCIAFVFYALNFGYFWILSKFSLGIDFGMSERRVASLFESAPWWMSQM